VAVAATILHQRRKHKCGRRISGAKRFKVTIVRGGEAGSLRLDLCQLAICHVRFGKYGGERIGPLGGGGADDMRSRALGVLV